MKDLLQQFINQTVDEVHQMYCDDKFEDGFAEAIQTFENAVVDFFNKDRPDIICRIVEYDQDYDETPDVLENLCDTIKGYKVDDYYTAEMNDVYFYILLLKEVKND